MNNLFFLVLPDGASRPTAAFTEIEDAIAWGLDRYGSDRFRIRGAAFAHDERAATALSGA